MTDQIPAGLTRAEAQAVREWAERARVAEVQDEVEFHAARVLLAVLPPHKGPRAAFPIPAPTAPRPKITARVLAADTQMTETSDAGLGITVDRTYTTTLQVRVPTMTPNNAPAPDYTAARDYAARVLGHPDKYGTEAVEAARVLQHLLPAPTLADMTTAERSATVGMWATIDPGDGSDTWQGIITRANHTVALVAHPSDLRVGMKPTATPAATVTPDPTVPRAWNANGTPAHPEPAPDCALTPGSTWGEGAHLEHALDQSPYTSAVIIDHDNDLAMWIDGYWEGPGFHPDASPGEGPWRIIWIGPER